MPAGEDRSYSGNAVPTTLTASITNSATTIPIAASGGWPDGTGGPFFAYVDSEVIKCSSRTGLTLNVQTTPVTGRGWDGTTAAAHTIGAAINHVYTATDAEEVNEHLSDTTLDHHTQYLTVARHDTSTRHGFGILPTAGTPSTSLVGDTATSGASNNVARVDHKHARETFGSPVTSGPVNADGSAITVSRSDHKHAGGIPIIANAAARNPSPALGEVQLESDVRRAVMWTGTRWQRGPIWSSLGRTGAAVARILPYSIPDGGASSYVLPWDTEIHDSDAWIPAPDGTTTFSLTCPSLEVSGLYICSVYLAWANIFSQRSYVEIIHTFSGPSINQHRSTTTGEDRGSVTTVLEVAAGDTIQLGLWQNSGVAQDTNGGYMRLYRLSS